MVQSFDKSYYAKNGQQDDRPALGWYKRLAQKYLDTKHLLDFGCGTGTLISRLSTIGQIDGFETSEFALDHAKIRNPMSTFYCQLERLPIKTFSAVISIHVIEHINPSDLDQAIEKLTQSLILGGRLMIVTPQFNGFAHKRLGINWDGFSDDTHCNLMTTANIRQLLLHHGYEPIKELTDGPWNGPYFTTLKLEKLLFQIPCALQVFTGLKLMPLSFGESYVGIWKSIKEK